MSERKPVGSTRTDKDTVVDLIGDDTTNSTASDRGLTAGPSTQDLLADIFGSGDPAPSQPIPTPAPRSSTSSDIMNLFNTSSPPPTSPPAAVPTSSSSIFDLVSPSAATPTPSAPPSKQQLQTYTAYEQNGLKITLTPKVSPTQPGIVQILARFTASVQADGVNFQIAVPKVCHTPL